MAKVRFEWDESKDLENQTKHNVPFAFAQCAFLDPHRVIVEDVSHSGGGQILLHWMCRRRNYDGKVYLSWQYYPYLWSWILEKRKEDI
jgi:hypothetical protein